MSLYEDWIVLAYDSEGKSKKIVWDEYMPLEQKIYEQILSEKIETISGTIKELGARFHMSNEYICGFIDGLNDATEKPISMEEVTPDYFVSLEINFEKLYKKMVEYKAKHLYTLPQWDNIFPQSVRDEMYHSQKISRTIVKETKPGRNDPCPCNSGKKYKRCCGAI